MLVALALLGLGLLVVRMLSPLPSLKGRPRTTALADADAADTRLGRAIDPRAAAHPGLTGIYALPDGRDAFAARMLLARAADRTLDVQYYIWRHDVTGALLFEALREAAERGVRVRLLLDDNPTSGLDDVIAALDAHPNVEVRLFNPFVIRSPRVLGFLTDFRRLNRRMHNKSFTADNRATIVGGRNIGDEYFDAAEAGDLAFSDLDVLAVGAIVPEVSRDFDRYWASGSSHPAGRILPAVPPDRVEDLRGEAAALAGAPAAAAYLRSARASPFAEELLRGRLPLEWAPARLVSDDPAKGLGLARPEALLAQKLREALGDPLTEVDLVSPYFVPTAAGVETFARLAERGVRVRILVNSLESTDVAAVHSGYAKYRRPLLEAGIVLYEMRLVSASEPEVQGPFGSSASSLHAKTFSVDGEQLFIGSFNFDPRSANLNTEMGLVIESTSLAARLTALFDERLPVTAYRVHRAASGDVYWTEQRADGEVVRHGTEPGTTWLQRAAVRILSWLPIEWVL